MQDDITRAFASVPLPKMRHMDPSLAEAMSAHAKRQGVDLAPATTERLRPVSERGAVAYSAVSVLSAETSWTPSLCCGAEQLITMVNPGVVLHSVRRAPASRGHPDARAPRHGQPVDDLADLVCADATEADYARLSAEAAAVRGPGAGRAGEGAAVTAGIPHCPAGLLRRDGVARHMSAPNHGQHTATGTLTERVACDHRL